jgi:uncharacterized protein (TIGR02996 family)
MTKELDFLNAIKDAPQDDTLRLAFADWLEENGQAERGEFVRLQVRGSHMSSDDPDMDLVFRNQKMLEKHGKRWLGSFNGLVEVGEWEFNRGLLDLMIGDPKHVKRLIGAVDAVSWPGFRKYIWISVATLPHR